MRVEKIILFIFCVSTMLMSCGGDDDEVNIQPPRDRAEQQEVDRVTLLNYLQTHYVNFGEIVNNPDVRIEDIVIEELPNDGILPNSDVNRLLIDVVTEEPAVFQGTDYVFYILNVNQGGGNESPNVSDGVRVNFSGNLLNGEIFDNSVNPVDFDLTQVVPGFSRAFLDFNTAETFQINTDGTVDFQNPGVGVVFMPSGLGFFDQFQPDIPQFSNLVFRFELFQAEILDHDNDGVPSYLEDVTQDFDITNDDTDADGVVDYLDIDDDGDGTPTIEEDLEPDTDLTVDRDGDGDPTNDIGDGNPLNDDTDGDGIPNYLDPDDTQSNSNS